jgi:crotonobetainyl-CoA:carnitine CoA-transferase CaiB-like acyl-CoA transferase
MPPAHPGQHTMEILRDWGFDAARIDALVEGRAVAAG